MEYELAKELRDAGFKGSGGWIKRDKDGEWKPYNNCEMDRLTFSTDAGHDYETSVPTLSELIKACGKGFQELKRGYKHFWAWGYINNEYKSFKGKTPEEAVARLWLALNKK